MEQARHSIRIFLAYALLTMPLVIWGAVRALEPHANLAVDWVPLSFPARHDYEQFRRLFGAGDSAIASWPGCTLDEPKLDALVAALREGTEFHDPHGAPYFAQVTSGREWAQQLSAEPLELSRAEIARRLQGPLIGPDQATTAVVIVFADRGVVQRVPLLEAIRATIVRIAGVAPDDIHLAGSVVDGAATDIYSQQSLRLYGLPSAAILFLLCWKSLRSWRAALLVFGVSIYCQAISLALVYYSGETISALLTVLPPLIQVLSIAGGIHFVNYYFDALHEVEGKRAAWAAFQTGWLPFVLSSGTTAVGMASLLISDLQPIRAFGAFAAAGVVAMTALLLALVPGVLSMWPIRPRPGLAHIPSAELSQRWESLARWLDRWHGGVLLLALVSLIGLGAGVRYLQMSVRIETLFHPSSRLLQDYAWLEEHLGPLVPIEILLQFERDCDLNSVERLGVLAQVEQQLHSLPQVGGVLSPRSFLPSPKARGGMRGVIARQMNATAFQRAREQLIQLKYFDDERGLETFRVTAYVSALAPLDYGRFLDEVRRAVAPALAPGGQPQRGLSATYTGIMPLVHEIQRYLYQDLFTSFLSAFVLITAVMTLAQSGIGAGLLSMASNIFPSLLVFGALGWIGTAMDIGSVMTASIALGMAIDDTLHFLTFFKRGIAADLSRREAVRAAYQACGNAMVQTSVTCSLGLAVFALSPFVPAGRFAAMMVVLILLALIGDLLVLPSILLSPLGKAFEPPRPARAPEANP